MQRVLDGLTATVSFTGQIMVGNSVYTGPIQWELVDAGGASQVVDPSMGASTPAVQAVIDPSDPQKLQLSKGDAGIDFAIVATYPGAVGPCSQPSVRLDLQWAAEAVWMPSICVSVS